jgi:hypothetical protein
MATDPRERSAKRRKKQSKAKSRVSYSFVLLSLMLFVGCISGLVAFVLGQQALQGVNPIPLGGKLPSQAVPTEKPSKKANTNSYWEENKKPVALAIQDELGADTKNNGSLMSLVHPTNATSANDIRMDVLIAQQTRSPIVPR